MRRDNMCPLYQSHHVLYQAPGPVLGGMGWRGRGLFFAVAASSATCPAERLDERQDERPAPDDSFPVLPAYAGPVIVTAPPEQARAGVPYTYHPAASDASVDGFSWSLQTAPPGMTVDRYSGVVAWTPAKKCRVRVELCARTVHGHETLQAWTVTVAKPPVVRAVVPHPRFVAALRHKRLCAPAPILEQRGLVRSVIIPFPPYRRAWTGAKQAAAGITCQAAAPPVRPPGAAVLPPLRL